MYSYINTFLSPAMFAFGWLAGLKRKRFPSCISKKFDYFWLLTMTKFRMSRLWSRALSCEDIGYQCVLHTSKDRKGPIRMQGSASAHETSVAICIKETQDSLAVLSKTVQDVYCITSTFVIPCIHWDYTSCADALSLHFDCIYNLYEYK